jgi:hypothetical protein
MKSVENYAPKLAVWTQPQLGLVRPQGRVRVDCTVRVRPDECRLVAPKRPSIAPADFRLAGVKLTLAGRCRIAAADP